MVTEIFSSRIGRWKSASQSATLGILISLTLTLFVTQGYRVSGACMEPHLATGERVLAYKLAYLIRPPRRGDIVIFAYPRDPRETYVKRVVGLPGETVAIKAGQVYINDAPLPEWYRVIPAHGDWGPAFIPHDQYFVMGDNRDVSDDSRYWGDLPSHEIVGRAVACYWPPKDCQILR
jgi:signal peptidase I